MKSSSIDENLQDAIEFFNLPEFPTGISQTIPYFSKRLKSWIKESASLIQDYVVDQNQNDDLPTSTLVSNYIKDLLSGVTMQHRCRLILLEVAAPESSPPLHKIALEFFGGIDENASRSRKLKKGYINVRLGEQNGEDSGERYGALTLDLARVSRDISPKNCPALWSSSDYTTTPPAIFSSLNPIDFASLNISLEMFLINIKS